MIKNIQIQKFIFRNTNKIFELVAQIQITKINKEIINKKSKLTK